MDVKQVWRAALGELQVSLSPANFETWLRDTALVEVDDNRFRISVPNGFAKDWLETRYRSLISQTLGRIVGYGVQVDFLVGPTDGGVDAAQADAGDAEQSSEAGNGHAAPVPVGPGAPRTSDLVPRAGGPSRPASAAPAMQVRVDPGRAGGEGGASNINQRYTFANFIVGSANRLAHAASL